MWLFQGMAFVCCQRYPILCHGRIPFLGPFHTLRPYESESYVTRQSKIDEALGAQVLYCTYRACTIWIWQVFHCSNGTSRNASAILCSTGLTLQMPKKSGKAR